MQKCIILALTLAIIGPTVNGFGQKVSLITYDQLYLTRAISNFSQHLYHEISTYNGNIIFSPLSVHAELTQITLGARGQTAKEIFEIVGLFPSPTFNPHRTYHNVLTQLESYKYVHVYPAFAITLLPVLLPRPEFLTQLSVNYGTVPVNPYLEEAEGALAAINDYIAHATEFHVKESIPPNTFFPNSGILLVNTVFVSGYWDEPFQVTQTRYGVFTRIDGTKNKLRLMSSIRSVAIKRDNTIRVDVVELSLTGGRYGFYIALPLSTRGITDLETLLVTPGQVDSLFAGLQQRTVKIVLPRFRMESRLNLLNNLQYLGVRTAFSAFADFSGISPNAHGLYIKKFNHQAVIDIQETGLNAAAATLTPISYHVNIHPRARLYNTFIADHPFLFFLRDKASGLILFQGKFSGAAL